MNARPRIFAPLPAALVEGTLSALASTDDLAEPEGKLADTVTVDEDDFFEAFEADEARTALREAAEAADREQEEILRRFRADLELSQALDLAIDELSVLASAVNRRYLRARAARGGVRVGRAQSLEAADGSEVEVTESEFVLAMLTQVLLSLEASAARLA